MYGFSDVHGTALTCDAERLGKSPVKHESQQKSSKTCGSKPYCFYFYTANYFLSHFCFFGLGLEYGINAILTF